MFVGVPILPSFLIYPLVVDVPTIPKPVISPFDTAVAAVICPCASIVVLYKPLLLAPTPLVA